MNQTQRSEPYQAAQLLMLISYTALAVILAIETLLLSWELWALPLIFSGVAVCWYVHVRQAMTSEQRLWVYAAIMMVTFYFYGTHLTSTYDMALVMVVAMLIFSVAREESLITLCQVVYYVTLVYDVVSLILAGTPVTVLFVTRTGLHLLLVTMAGWLARSTIRSWEQVLQASDDQIASLDKTAERMNTFMANLSHELRTPINAIQGMAGVLLEQDADASVRRDLMTVRDAGSRMAEQISDIMDYSELEMGKLVVNSETYMISSLFNDLVVELRPRIPEKVELVIDIDADIPSSMVSDAGKLRKILFHIINNSLKYTLEGGVYVHASAVRQDYGINLCVEVADTGIGMSEDDIEQVSQRFYQAESGKFVYTGGLGLGLPIAYGLVRSLGGFLSIQSKPKQGTTVRLSIPQEIADDCNCMSIAKPQSVVLGCFVDMGKFANPRVREFYDAMLSNAAQGLGVPIHLVGSERDLDRFVSKAGITHLFVGEEEYLQAQNHLESVARTIPVIVMADEGFALPEASSANLLPRPLYGFPMASVLNSGIGAGAGRVRQARWPGVRALVVDDEPMNLNVASGILRKYGMLVTTASSGPDAIRQCGEAHFDIVFMDHMMPGMDGVEAMKRIRHLAEAENRELPIVALTANALSSAREMFMAEGFDGFVSKPIELPELERVLRRVLPKSFITFSGDADGAGAPSGGTGEAVAGAAGNAAGSGSPDDAIRVLEGRGLNAKEGLRYCQGDAPFYFSLLHQYASDHRGKKEALEQFLAAGDLANYAIVAHALKSTSAMIGATVLSDEARAMEEAAKEQRMSYVGAHHGGLLAAYDAVVEAIAAAFPEVAALQAEAQSNDEVLEFAAAADEEPLEFAPAADDEPLEFAPAAEFDGPLEFAATADDEPLEFAPAADDDDVLEFMPEED